MQVYSQVNVSIFYFKWLGSVLLILSVVEESVFPSNPLLTDTSLKYKIMY